MRKLNWETIFWGISFYEITNLEDFNPNSLNPGNIVQIKIPSSNYPCLNQLQSLGFVVAECEVIFEKKLISNSIVSNNINFYHQCFLFDKP